MNLKFKSIIAVSSICCVLLNNMCAAADEDKVGFSYNAENRTITCSGSLNNAYADDLFIILKPVDSEEWVDDRSYAYQTQVDDNSFDKKLLLAGDIPSGEYSIYISVRSSEVKACFFVVDANAIKNIITEINSADNTSMRQILSEAVLHDIGFSEADSRSAALIAEYIYSHRPTNGYDVPGFADMLSEAQAVIRVTGGNTAETIEKNARYLGVDYNTYASLGQSAQKELNELLEKIDISKGYSFADYYNQMLYIAQIRASEGPEQMKKAVLSDTAVLGSVMTSYNSLSDYNKELVFGDLFSSRKTIETIEQLKALFGQAVKQHEQAASNSSTTGGGGGGGGGGGAINNTVKSSGAIAAIPQAAETPGNKTESEKTDFLDMHGHWAYQTVIEMADLGVINGYDDKTFRPELPISRAELTVMISRLLQIRESQDTKFNDVNNDSWYFGQINGASDAGIISGYDNGSFMPDSYLSRQDAAVILYNSAVYAGAAISGDFKFNDSISISDYAEIPVGALAYAGIILGDNGYFRPHDAVTRAEAAALLQRIKNIIQEES